MKYTSRIFRMTYSERFSLIDHKLVYLGYVIIVEFNE